MEETLIPRQPVVVTPKSKPLWASRLWNENTKDNQSQTAKLALSYKQSNNFLPLLLPLLCPSLSWLLWGRARDHSPFGAVRCQLIFLLKLSKCVIHLSVYFLSTGFWKHLSTSVGLSFSVSIYFSWRPPRSDPPPLRPYKLVWLLGNPETQCHPGTSLLLC